MINKLVLKSRLHEYVPGILPLLNMGRMKPSFFVVGFQKCGTTSVYNQLMKVRGAKPGLIKENDTLALKNGDHRIFQLSFPYSWSGRFTGDASHLHTYTPFGLDRIEKYYPKSKLVAVMRNPIDRAYSHFNMDKKNGYVPANWTFRTYVDVEMRIRSEIRDTSNIEEVYNGTKLFHSKYGWALTRSIYHPYIKRVMDSGNDVHIMFLEEYQNDYVGQFTKLLEFLNIDGEVPSNEVHNKGAYKDDLDPALRTELEEFFAPHDEKLEQLIGRSLPWKNPNN